MTDQRIAKYIAKYIDCPDFMAPLYTPELRAIVPDLQINIGSPSPDEVRAMLADCAYAMNDHTYMPADLLADCPTLKAIVFMGTGASSYIDMAAAERLGIPVRRIKGYGDRTVAEHAVGLMFAAVRQIAVMDRNVRAGDWGPLSGFELAGRTLGVVGTGGIGTEMVRLGDALGMTVLAWNRSGVPDDLPCRSAELDDLLARAHVVSLHLGLTEQTTGLIDRRRLALMAPEAILINTARGGLVDEAALIDALGSGRLAHAGLDVFEKEPLQADHPLCRLANVALTCHGAFLTDEATTRLFRWALEALRDERDAGA